MFLRKYRAEVVGMLLEEFDVEKYERTLKMEGYEVGHIEGLTEGHSTGDAERLVKSVEELMKKLQLKLPQACELIGVTEEEYWKAKERIGKYE